MTFRAAVFFTVSAETKADVIDHLANVFFANPEIQDGVFEGMHGQIIDGWNIDEDGIEEIVPWEWDE